MNKFKKKKKTHFESDGGKDINCCVSKVVEVEFVLFCFLKGKSRSCTPQFCVPQPRCHEASLVRGPHQHYLRTLQNRTPACQDKIQKIQKKKMKKKIEKKNHN